MKTYSLSEMKDKYIGKPDSKAREEYERTLCLKLAEHKLEQEWNNKSNDHWDDFFRNSPKV